MDGSGAASGRETDESQQKSTADNTVESAPGLAADNGAADDATQTTPAVTVPSPFATIHPTPGVEICKF